MIFMVVELVSFSVRSVRAHVTVWRLHQDLEVRHRLEVLQISLGREEAAVSGQRPAGRAQVRLRTLDGRAETIEHDVCAAVL